MKNDDYPGIKPVENKFLKFVLISLLVLAGVGAVGVAVVGGFPKSIVSINPISDAVATLFATIFCILCVVGIVCIFKKSIRRSAFVVTCVAGILLLIFGCFNLLLERISYQTAKNNPPVERLCVITYHKHHHSEYLTIKQRKDLFGNKEDVEEHSTVDKYNMSFRFLDDGKEESISGDYPFEYYNLVSEGDTCIAYVRDGAFGIKFITNMKCVRRFVPPVYENEDENWDENEDDPSTNSGQENQNENE